MRRGFLLFVLAAALTFGATDISGTWNVTVEIQGNSGSPKFVLKQEGKKLTGTYSGLLGSAPLTGTIDGDKVEWQFEVKSEQATGTVKYHGTVTGGKMRGTVAYADLGEGTWEATKQ